MKSIVLTSMVIMLAIFAWGMTSDYSVVVVHDGHHDYHGSGIGGALLSSIVGFCVAILMAFVFVGVGLFIVGIFAFVGFIIAVSLFPVVFPLLLPLFLVWLVVAIFRRKSVTEEAASR